ncbi:ATP-binding cassette domain-containing protein [Aeromonas veronii]
MTPLPPQEAEWDLPLADLLTRYPPLADLLPGYGLNASAATTSLRQALAQLPESHFDDIGLSRAQLQQNLTRLLHTLSQQQAHSARLRLDSLTLLGGQNKFGAAEPISLTLPTGSVTSIVGPTGSGKSRLLADIEWMAQGDTPTRRRILINGQTPDPALRFSLEHKLVAQLSQNMNFVMDTSVGDFIALHAESRGIAPEQVVDDILQHANLLAGEPFTPQTALTALSGGQSRALMIADTAFLSASPVVLIDEVENAGIDRQRALQLLVRQEKIVLIATHDPLLALMADQRLVIRHGGIQHILVTSAAERANLARLAAMDAQIQALRQRLRHGERIDTLAACEPDSR